VTYKKKLKFKKTKSGHIGGFSELDGEGVFRNIFFYNDANQTENFTEIKIENDIYYGVKNTINP